MPRIVKAVEATAPTRVDLAGDSLDVWPLVQDAAVAVTVAIDRRVWCRVAPRSDGVRFESKDALVRIEAASVEEMLAGQRPPLAAHVLSSLGIETGVEIVTRSRVPDGAGLGESGALAAALVAAVSAAADGDHRRDAGRLASDAETRWRGRAAGVRDALTALHGGPLAVHLEAAAPRVERLSADAAAIEECLLLASTGAAPPESADAALLKRRLDADPEVRRHLDAIAELSRRMALALAGPGLAEVPGLLEAEWEARRRLEPESATPERERLARLARECGGAARPCRGSVVALWAAPGARGRGAREALEQVLKEEGVPAFPFRADLQGLEVEPA